MLGPDTYYSEARDIVNIEKDLAKVSIVNQSLQCNGDPESIPCPPHSLSDFCQQWSERPKFEIQPNSSTTDAANLLETGTNIMHVFMFDFWPLHCM